MSSPSSRTACPPSRASSPWRSSSRPSAGRSRRSSRPSSMTPLAAASIAQVHAATLKSGEEVVVKILRPGMHEVIERDLRSARHPGRARRRVLGGRAAAAAHGARERVPQDHSRRARSHARGGQRRPAEAQFRGLDAPLRSGGVLGLLPQQRDGHGAHPRHHREPHGGAARARHEHREARRERRRDLFHPGVPAQFLSCRHASGQHLRADGRSAESALCRGGFRHRRHPAAARPALSCGEFPGLFRSRLRAASRRCTSNRAGCPDRHGSTSSSPRCARCASRSSTSR